MSCQFRCLRDAGIPVAIGTDEASADDSVSVFGAMKLVGPVHNIADPNFDQWLKTGEILDCVLSGGVQVTHRPDTGRVAARLPPDLILLNLDKLPFTPLNDVERQLVYGKPASSLRTTVVWATSPSVTTRSSPSTRKHCVPKFVGDARRGAAPPAGRGDGAGMPPP